jgi:hypothetical protein
MVMLRWSNQKEGVTMVAKKVTLNGPIPPAASVFPKGVAWKKSPSPEDADFITNIWAFKKQADPTGVPAATVAQFAVRYLASAEAAPELRAMQGDPSEGSEDNPADEGEDDGGGN